MKNTALIFFLSVLFSGLYAQNQPLHSDSVVNRGMAVEVSAGYSMALGAYSSSDKQNNKSGYATSGWQVQVTFDWMGKKVIGYALQYTYQRNPMKDAANLVYPAGVNDSVGTRDWSSQYLLVGPVFMKTIKRVHVDAKVLGGIIVSTGSCFDTPDPTAATPYSYDENVAIGFGYQISAGIGYAISQHFALKFNLGLIGGWPGKHRQYPEQFVGFKEIIDPITGVTSYYPMYNAQVYEINKVVTTLNPSIGLVYRF